MVGAALAVVLGGTRNAASAVPAVGGGGAAGAGAAWRACSSWPVAGAVVGVGTLAVGAVSTV
eukprot:3838631-Alexandrium_andersonii.AAC.1